MKYGLTRELAALVIARDVRCVYCRIELVHGSKDKRTQPSWEHIDNDGHATHDNMALCCGPCNSSKGVKPLETWLESAYCKRKRINKRTVAKIIRLALR